MYATILGHFSTLVIDTIVQNHINIWATPYTRTMLYLGGQSEVFSKVVLGFRNFGYDFLGVGKYV